MFVKLTTPNQPAFRIADQVSGIGFKVGGRSSETFEGKR